MKATKYKCDCGECFTCYKREYYQDNCRREPKFNMTCQEIADELGISQQGVDHILKKAMIKFKSKWIEMYGEYPPTLTDRELFDSFALHSKLLKILRIKNK